MICETNEIESQTPYLDGLTNRNITARLIDNKIRLSPKELITPKIAEVIKLNRDAVIAELRATMPAISLEAIASDGPPTAAGNPLEGRIDKCLACGSAASYVPYTDDAGEACGWGWWYECTECGDCRAIQAIVDYDAPQDNPYAVRQLALG
jgi:hypothetical protein